MGSILWERYARNSLNYANKGERSHGLVAGCKSGFTTAPYVSHLASHSVNFPGDGIFAFSWWTRH
ncbi:hypothetical protein GQ600_7972 [Phytophthora cactorum]|nr:hypothetical protein GQ600_7972 [Phytophthora cactorum]